MDKFSFRSQLTAVLAIGIVLFGSLPAFATPTVLTVIPLKLNNYNVLAGDLAITYTACDNTNGNSFVATGQEIIMVQNADGAAAHTFTVTSVADALGRFDTSLTGYSVPLSGFAAVQMKYLTGWLSGTTVTLACNSAQIKFAIV